MATLNILKLKKLLMMTINFFSMIVLCVKQKLQHWT